jgi:hypothetical protein
MMGVGDVFCPFRTTGPFHYVQPVVGRAPQEGRTHQVGAGCVELGHEQVAAVEVGNPTLVGNQVALRVERLVESGATAALRLSCRS